MIFLLLSLVCTGPGQVCLPSLLPVLLHRLHRVWCGVDAAPRDNEISSPADSRSRCLVLLTKLISLRRDVHASGEDHKVLLIRGGADFRLHLAQSASRHESHDEVLVFPGIVDRGRSILTCSQRTLGGHLCQDQEAAFGAVGEVRRRRSLGESLDNTLTRQDAAVDDVGPFRDPKSTTVVLLLDSVSDVNEFPVFKDEEVVLLRKGLETLDGLVTEIGEDVNVGFNDGDVGAETCSPESPLISLHGGD